MFDLVTTVSAFVLGAALARANSCTVASAQRLVLHGRSDWLLGLGVAVCWAGLTLAGFALFLPQVVVLPAQLPVNWQVVCGGVLLGLGATLNQGCFLGSVARLGRGELAYLFTLAGIALALAVSHWLVPAARGAPIGLIGTGYRSSDWLLKAAVVFVPFVVFGLWRWYQHRQQPMLALHIVGISGGTIYACNPDWSYTTGLSQVATSGVTADSLVAQSAAIAVVAGVAASAYRSRTARLRVPDLPGGSARLAGGLLMGTGAILVPGGNDTLMLWAIPGLTFYGVAAYAIMLATIIGVMAALRYSRVAMR